MAIPLHIHSRGDYKYTTEAITEAEALAIQRARAVIKSGHRRRRGPIAHTSTDVWQLHTHNSLQLGWKRLDLEARLCSVRVVAVHKRSERRNLQRQAQRHGCGCQGVVWCAQRYLLSECGQFALRCDKRARTSHGSVHIPSDIAMQTVITDIRASQALCQGISSTRQRRGAVCVLAECMASCPLRQVEIGRGQILSPHSRVERLKDIRTCSSLELLVIARTSYGRTSPHAHSPAHTSAPEPRALDIFKEPAKSAQTFLKFNNNHQIPR